MSQTEIPATMCAVVTRGHGGIEQLEYREDWPTPIAAPGEALIEVGACGLNNTDINTRSGWYAKSVREGTTLAGSIQGFIETGDDGVWGESVQFPRIQGADVCGRVVAIGDGVSRELIGQRVMIETWIRDWNDPNNIRKCRYFGSECDGGYAEYTVIDVRNVHSIESLLSDAELVQLIRRRSATPVALYSESKANQLWGIGADAILPREPRDLPAALDQAIGRRSVDVIADVVGGPVWPQLIDVLRPSGRYTCAGATVIPQGLFARLIGYIERSEVSPVLAATYPLRDLTLAQKAFLVKQHLGNIVAIVRDPNKMRNETIGSIAAV